MLREPWQIDMLGGLRARLGGRAITRFRTQKTGALLAYLAYYSQQAHPREQLIELLWPDTTPEKARHSLSMALSSLRHQLEPPGTPAGTVLVADRFHLHLNPEAFRTDVAAFEALVQTAANVEPEQRATRLGEALALYRGSLLPGYYETWITVEQQRLSELFLQTLRTLTAQWRQEGNLTQALQAARQAVRVEPLLEEVHFELMRLYAEAGQAAAALRQYARLQQNLRDQLAQSPSAPIQAFAAQLLARIKKGDADLSLPLPTSPLPAPSLEATSAPSAPLGTTAASTPVPKRLLRLPPQWNRFFGREEERDRLLALLTTGTSSRLITLTGPGGSGKTRLALEGARQAAEAFAGAVCYVPLADLTDPCRLPDALVDALGLPRSPQPEPLEQVIAFLNTPSTGEESRIGETPASLRSLLLLDNLEQLLDGEAGREGQATEKAGHESAAASPETQAPLTVAEVVRVLLERVPGLTLLVTSRQRIQLTAERVLPVPPLPTPSLPGTPERLLEFASVQLFVDRAQAAKPDFQVTPTNARAIAEVCNRLEGIPLAIELAAARALVMTPSQMLSQLSRRFHWLVSRGRDLSERHRSLWAACSWSLRLLSPELRQFFARLSVFRGGWSLDAAEDLNTQIPEYSVLDYLAQLQECSLIFSEESGETLRFRILETLREFAETQLPSEERFTLQKQHAELFTHLAEQAHAAQGQEEEIWLERLHVELENIRAALRWCLEEGGDAEKGLHLASLLILFWRLRGHWAEGRQWLEAALQKAPQEALSLRARALRGVGQLAKFLGDYEGAHACCEQALTLCQELNDKSGMCSTLTTLGNMAQEKGEWERAEKFYSECFTLAHQENDRLVIANAYNNLGSVAIARRDFAQAQRYFEQSLEISRAEDDKLHRAFALNSLGTIAKQLGDKLRARDLYEESLALRRESGDKQGLAYALGMLAEQEMNLGNYDRAYVLAEEGQRTFEELGDRRMLAIYLGLWGSLACKRGEYATARTLYLRSLQGVLEVGALANIPYILEGLAQLAEAEEIPERMVCLHAAAYALRIASGVSWTLPRQALDKARQAIGEERYDQVWQQGLAMSQEQCVAYARQIEPFAPLPARHP